MSIRRILVCGDRHWTNRARIEQLLREYPTVEVIIHGGANGADTLAGDISAELGLVTIVYPAEWRHYHKGAGLRRNAQMLREGEPDLVLAFHDDIATSKGTKDMLARTREAGVPWRLLTSKGEMRWRQ